MKSTLQTAIFAGGCFWCIESIFNQIKGVKSVTSGYIGGTTNNPTYESVCSGLTDHAEAVLISFDSSIITFDTLLDIFFAIHDPTQLNRQGADIGTQYRSEVFATETAQLKLVQDKINELQPLFDKPIVTKIETATTFYPAEDYHQNYFIQNPNRPGYCQMVVAPKFAKARMKFDALWKD